MSRKLNFVILFTVCVTCFAEPIRVLTIGNSFSVPMTYWLPLVAKSAGVEIEVEDITIGGCTMERHWSNITKEANEPGYQFFKDFTYLQKITSKPWDFVTIQQASHESWRIESYRPYAQQLRDYIRANAPTARVLIQMTWAWRQDDPRYQTLPKKWYDDPLYELNKQDPQGYMHFRILQSYHQIAQELGLRIIPTGIAVQAARNTQSPKYIPFNPKDYKYPDLPDVSRALCGDIKWNNSHTALTGDTAHLNQRGLFLQACVWFGIITGHPVSEITYQPQGMTPEDIAFLKEVAQATLNIYPKGK
ncbi:MAG: DUF4886 domain-containing protein [Victivallales bacterium]|nr:DUF4886 domain-containing protein [Victivallales bacterium]